MAMAPAGEAEEATRLRKPRFSFEENQILIREVRAHYPQLYGAHSRRVSVAERRGVWDGIAAKINGITSWKRTGQEVQKRWNDFKRRTKEKLARVPHSTQGAGPAADEAFSAEEETLFAILGHGVAGPGSGAGAAAEPPPAASSEPLPPAAPSACAPRAGCAEDLRREERRPDTPAQSKGGSRSPDPWARPTGKPSAPIKERETPPPAAPQSPPGPAAPHPHLQLPPGPRPPQSPDPALDLLRAQQETADAIRELAGTLRQGLAKLTEALSALLPLLPGAPGVPQPHHPQPPPPHLPAPPRPPLPASPVPKVELNPEPVSLVAARGVIVSPRGEDAGARPPLAPLPPPDSPPCKRRKGFPTGKRRGRWKTP